MEKFSKHSPLLAIIMIAVLVATAQAYSPSPNARLLNNPTDEVDRPITAPTSGADPATLDEGLYSYFPLDSKDDALEYAITGETSTISYTAGLLGNALSVPTDVDNSMIFFGDTIDNKDNTYRDVLYQDTTINVWVNINQFDSLSDGQLQIFGDSPHESAVCDTNHWMLVIRNVPGCEYGNCPDTHGSEAIAIQATSQNADGSWDPDNTVLLEALEGELQTGRWYMITVTHDATEHIWQIYIDGVLEASLSKEEGIGPGATTRPCTYAIGDRPSSNAYGKPFSGRIDELGVWNRVLTDGEVDQLYNGGAGLSLVDGLTISGNVSDSIGDPLSETIIDYGSGTIATDASGDYTISGLISGTYTLTPTLTSYTFTPVTRTVSVPPDATGQDFVGSDVSAIDLSIDEVAPVQVLEGQDLVRGKATAIKVVVRKSGAQDVNDVSVQVNTGSFESSVFYVADLHSNSNTKYALINDNNDYPLNFTASEITKTVYFFTDEFTPDGNNFEVGAEVDYQDAIPETNETNNVATSASVPVRDTSWGELFPNLYIHYFRTDWGDSSYQDFENYADYSNDFLLGTYPVASEDFTPGMSRFYTGSTLLFRGLDGLLPEEDLGLWMLDTFLRLRLAHPMADRFVAVVPNGWFENNTIGVISQSTGVMNTNLPWFVVAEARTGQHPNGPAASTIAHEIGHSYGLHLECEDYDADCDGQPDPGYIGTRVEPGIWVEKRIPMLDSNLRPIYSFMGAYSSNTEYWAKIADFSELLDDSTPLRSPQSSEQVSASEAILVTGMFDVTGTVTLDNWYVLAQAELSTLSPGPYTFEYLDESGETLYEQSFNVSFSIHGIELSETPFAYTLPYIEGMAEVIIREDEAVLAKKTISPSPPAVTILTPNGGEQVKGEVNIEWAASDADGNQLFFSVFYSQDGGTNWEPIASNITDTNYAWDLSGLPAGSEHLVKVIATDGFNTAQDESDATFTVQHSLYLPNVIRQLP